MASQNPRSTDDLTLRLATIPDTADLHSPPYTAVVFPPRAPMRRAVHHLLARLRHLAMASDAESELFDRLDREIGKSGLLGPR